MKLRQPAGRSWRRPALFLLLVAAAYAAWMIGRVQAQSEERMLRLGAALARAPAELRSSDVEINGARLRVTSGVADASVAEILDAAHRVCQRSELDAGAFADALPEGGEGPGWLDPVMRWDDGSEGFVGCLGAEAGGLEWERFQATGDLSDVGGLRYLYAIRRGERTQLVGVRSVGALRLDAMFPAQGDAPGFDVDDVPRAPGARRTLSVREVGAPSAMTVHAAPTGSDLRDHYLHSLPALGWRVAPGRERTLRASRGESHALLTFGDSERGEWVTVLFEEPRP